MRLKIKQARIDLNDVVRHAVELHAFQIAELCKKISRFYISCLCVITQSDQDLGPRAIIKHNNKFRVFQSSRPRSYAKTG